jgi:dipicolinate synthase subunit A
MNKNKTILVAGGDLRQVYTAQILAKENKVYTLGFDKSLLPSDKIKPIESPIMLEERVDFLILPLPVSTDGITLNTPFFRYSIPVESLPGMIKDGGIVFGGKFSEKIKDVFESKGIETIDYFEREELSVLNAIPTAEGAVQIAMEELPCTIFGQNVLVTGMGRISKVLVRILTALGAKTTVAARKYSDLAWAEIYGCRGVHISRLDESLGEYDIIFNTVPALLFDEKRLKKLKKSCLAIDLASKPGGFDLDAASANGVKTIWALSLPGKVAPVTSGEIIAHTILNILNERGEDNG